MGRGLKTELPPGEVSLCGHEPRLEQRKTRTSHRTGPAGLVVAAHRAGDWSAPGNGGLYLRGAGIALRRPGGLGRQRPSKAAVNPITDSEGGDSKPAIEVITGFLAWKPGCGRRATANLTVN